MPVGVGITIVDDVSVVEGITEDEESEDPLLISKKKTWLTN